MIGPARLLSAAVGLALIGFAIAVIDHACSVIRRELRQPAG